MKKKKLKFYILLGFVFYSLLWLLITIILTGIIYKSGLPYDEGQFIAVIHISKVTYFLFLLMLFSTAIIGIIYSKKKEKLEVYKGFIYSIVYCLFLIGIYIFLFIIPWWSSNFPCAKWHLQMPLSWGITSCNWSKHNFSFNY